MKIEVWPIERPIPYARNPRVNAEAIEKVAASLQEFGWQQPIVVDGDGVVVVGHTRLAAARRLGWSEAPVVVACDLSPAQVKAYRLADNRTQEQSSWDRDKLAAEIEGLQLADFPVSLSGVEVDEVAELLKARGDLLEPRGSLEERVSKIVRQRLHLTWGTVNVPITPEEKLILDQTYERWQEAEAPGSGFAEFLLAGGRERAAQ